MLPVHIDGSLGLFEGTGKGDPDIGMLGFPGTIHDTAHDGHIKLLHPGVEVPPGRHPGPDVSLDFLSHFLKEGAGGPATSGTGRDLGLEAPKTQGLEDLLGHPDFLGAVSPRLRGKGHPNGIADALQQQGRQTGRGGNNALRPHPRLRQPQVEGVVAPGSHLTVHGHQLRHAGYLPREDDPVMGEPGLLRQGSGSHGALHHGVPQNGSGLLRLRGPGVLVHELREQALVQRSPIHADANRFPVFHRHSYDGLEVVIPAGGAHVPRIDPVFGQGRCAVRKSGQEDVAVVVEIPDDGRFHSGIPQASNDLRYGPGRSLVVHRHPDDLTPGLGKGHHLGHGGIHIRRVGVGHGLDHHRILPPHRHPTHIHLHRLSTSDHRHQKLLSRVHGPRTSRDPGGPEDPGFPGPEDEPYLLGPTTTKVACLSFRFRPPGARRHSSSLSFSRRCNSPRVGSVRRTGCRTARYLRRCAVT